MQMVHNFKDKMIIKSTNSGNSGYPAYSQSINTQHIYRKKWSLLSFCTNAQADLSIISLPTAYGTFSWDTRLYPVKLF